MQRRSASAKPAFNAGLTLFTEPEAPCSQWLRVLLAEKDIEGARVEEVHPGDASEDFLILSPTGVLPVLADRTGVVTGAAVIAEYIDERYPHPPLMPTGPVLHAQARMLMQQFEHVVLPAAARLRPRRALPAACGELLRDAASRFSGRGAPDGICGSGYTVVDSAMAVLLARMRDARVQLPVKNPGFSRYAERLLARPAVVQVFDP